MAAISPEPPATSSEQTIQSRETPQPWSGPREGEGPLDPIYVFLMIAVPIIVGALFTYDHRNQGVRITFIILCGAMPAKDSTFPTQIERNMDSESFTYTSIPPGRNFRLLRILPGASDDALACEVFVSDLDNSTPYTALSYVWGNPDKVGNLELSGHACRITRSLSDGLRRLRKPDEAQVAWADAICINQNDDIEKGHQVDLMGDIYDNAHHVVVWLGPDPTTSASEAFRCLQTINYKLYTKTDKEYFYPDEKEMGTVYMKTEADPEPRAMSRPVGRRSVHRSVLGEKGTDCVGRLFDLSWFSRVWVLQEVGLAGSATAIWGDSSIEFGEIASFIWNVYYTEELRHALGDEITQKLSGAPLYSVWNVWSTYEKKESWIYRTPLLRSCAELIAGQCSIDFVLVLEASRYFNATNQLDHVYAFLGHPKARNPVTKAPWLQANYSLDVQEQHRLLAASLSQDSLNFLVQAHQTEESLRLESGYPSWVPMWNEKTENHADAFWEAWDASLRKEEGKTFKTYADGHRLRVSGLIIGEIDQFTRTMESSDFDVEKDFGGLLIDLCWDLAGRRPNPYSPKEVLAAFASTLSCHYKIRGNQPLDGRERVVEQLAGYCMHLNNGFYQAHLVPKHGDGFWNLNTVLEVGKSFTPSFKSHAVNRRFFNTTDGYWGMGPSAMQSGDICAVLLGADVPFVLRPKGDAGEYQVVGQCYMYNFMDGQAVMASRAGESGYDEREIILV
ncbi:hypothetical protein FPSE_05327 [Fusarium pseudograminearum CS3096]|uniref:Heterokaryon incompatibility domain-containing protein n=1 Tax=Fusarium pseudograminearum (strain CS3096) TaxID=1028729 RepID=K3VIX7_FUSPC|nr:hypothetical protein FPSE_05327 [Fusarium pseudograminearum CS3096]EKJ74577.1 hypothetical protein FPSE_05327 [Fusarium pseudograminearum CS3096]